MGLARCATNSVHSCPSTTGLRSNDLFLDEEKRQAFRQLCEQYLFNLESHQPSFRGLVQFDSI